MDKFQIFILLMAAAILLVGLAQKLKLPYPLALIIGGALFGFMPGVNNVSFEPDLLLVIVLPPLLQYGAIWISFRNFKKNIKDIFSLALGLVAATTLIVGIFFKWLFPEASWALAFAFGAIVSPPDAVSATTILKRFNIGSDLTSVLEGESLINDAAALVIYKLSVMALLTGFFSFKEAGVEFTKMAIGGLAFGALCGYLIQQFIQRFLLPVVAVMLSFTLPYIVYILADALEVSGVLAVVAFGLVTSWFLTKHYDSFRRLLSIPIWSVFVILLNCFVFILIGLQLKGLTEGFTAVEMYRYSGYALVITCLMILVRLIWVSAKPSFCFFKKCQDPLTQHFRDRAIVAWCGMRGIISLACAMALPLSVAGRDIVIFITLEVILLTLIIPSLSLPWLLKRLKVHPRLDTDSVSRIRKQLLETADKEVGNLLHLAEEERTFLRNYVHVRHRALEISSSNEEEPKRLDQARRKLLQFQRQDLLKLWEQGEIDDILVKNLEIELDLEEQLSIRAEIH